MPIIDLIPHCGDGSTHKLVNKAIRAEIPGGNYALDGLWELHRPVRSLKQNESPFRHDAQAAYDSLRKVIGGMSDLIAHKYQFGGPRGAAAQTAVESQGDKTAPVVKAALCAGPAAATAVRPRGMADARASLSAMVRSRRVTPDLPPSSEDIDPP